jgi:hypothetical protein
MTHRINASSFGNQVLGPFGLLLIGIVGWACDWAHRSDGRWARARLLVATVVVELITVIGWTVDHVPPIELRNGNGSGFRTVEFKSGEHMR